MKKKLLRPPGRDGGIVFKPPIAQFFQSAGVNSRVGTAHQPYFFNPGVSVKFFSVDIFSPGEKGFIFVDTDRVEVAAKVPCGGAVALEDFVVSDRLLHDFPSPPEREWLDFFGRIEKRLADDHSNGIEKCMAQFLRFKEIALSKSGVPLLKDVLSSSFIEFSGLAAKYTHLSSLLRGSDFADLVGTISRDGKRFRRIFNEALDEYRKEFRFRYRNFPFPKLQEDELPFWIVKNGLRRRCFAGDLAGVGRCGELIFPRAATLTIFLRLYRLDYFIHGVGGWNYEWVQDRIIERFFNRTPPPYAVASGTFFAAGNRERELPYFFFDPEEIKARIRDYAKEQVSPGDVNGH